MATAYRSGHIGVIYGSYPKLLVIGSQLFADREATHDGVARNRGVEIGLAEITLEPTTPNMQVLLYPRSRGVYLLDGASMLRFTHGVLTSGVPRATEKSVI